MNIFSYAGQKYAEAVLTEKKSTIFLWMLNYFFKVLWKQNSLEMKYFEMKKKL